MWLNILIHQILFEILQPFRHILREFTSLFFVVFIFLCVFGFWWSTRRVSSWILTHSLTSFLCWIFRTDHRIVRWRCWRSMWRWKRGTRRQAKDNEWYVVRYISIDSFVFFWWDVVFDHWSSGKCTHDPRRASRVKELRVFLQRSITVTKKSNSLTYTVAPSLVCTSPLAVITVVGFFDVLMVSNSAELRSLLLTICILAQESTTNSLSSGFMVDAAVIIHSLVGW